MKLCKKCNVVIPYREIRDGKKINLQRRKYCTTCSPVGARIKESYPVYIDDNEREVLCSRCNRPHRRGHGKSKDVCDACRITIGRANLKLLAIEYKGGKCIICGYNKCARALQFHHIDPNEKEFNISMTTAFTLERNKAELDKCVLLCANCHSEIHDGMVQLDDFLT